MGGIGRGRRQSSGGEGRGGEDRGGEGRGGTDYTRIHLTSQRTRCRRDDAGSSLVLAECCA